MIALRTGVVSFGVEGVLFSCRKQERRIFMSKELAKTYDPKDLRNVFTEMDG